MDTKASVLKRAVLLIVVILATAVFITRIAPAVITAMLFPSPRSPVLTEARFASDVSYAPHPDLCDGLGEIQGRIVDIDGEPIPDLTVRIHRTGGSISRALLTTDDTGAYHFQIVYDQDEIFFIAIVSPDEQLAFSEFIRVRWVPDDCERNLITVNFTEKD